jgi:hypothetical protein
MTSNPDLITYQSWCAEQQITIESLREDKDELKRRVAELEGHVATLTSMVERLQIANSQGREL